MEHFPLCGCEWTLTCDLYLQTWSQQDQDETAHTHKHTHPFNGPFSGSTQVSRYQKGKTNLDFTGARESGISWAICKSVPCSRQITMPVPHHSSFLQARCPSCRPTNSVKALKATKMKQHTSKKFHQILITLQTDGHEQLCFRVRHYLSVYTEYSFLTLCDEIIARHWEDFKIVLPQLCAIYLKTYQFYHAIF